MDYIAGLFNMDTNVHIIFHKEDADGWSSAAIVAIEMYLYYGKKAKFYPYTYGMNLPKLKENDVVFFTDIAPKYDSPEFKYMFETVKFIFICDHHISSAKALLAYNNDTSIEIYNTYTMQYNGKDKLIAIYGDGIAGCEVAYLTIQRYSGNIRKYNDIPEFLLPHIIYGDNTVGCILPHFVKIISIYDAWQKDNSLFDYSIKFMHGLMQKLFMPTNDAFIYDPKQNLWFTLYEEDASLISEIESIGDIILQYKEKQAAQACNKSGFKAKLPTKTYGDINVVFMTGNGYNSQSFASINLQDIDAMLTCNLVKAGWSYSIYSLKDNTNCSLIASEFGGGGHAKASGFLRPIESNPLEIFENIVPLRKKDYVL